jgi:hypothetical protein
MAKQGHKKTKRAAEVSAAVIILLGLGAGVVGVMIYNHNKQAATPLPPLPPLPPPAIASNPPVIAPSPPVSTFPTTRLDQRLR